MAKRDQQFIQAMQNIANTLQAIQAAAAAVPPPPEAGAAAAAPQFVQFNDGTPFNLRTRSGTAAWDKACAPLPEPWDGSLETFPAMVVNLSMKALLCKWNAPAPHGILNIPVAGGGTKNLFTEYHSISNANIEAARHDSGFT